MGAGASCTSSDVSKAAAEAKHEQIKAALSMLPMTDAKEEEIKAAVGAAAAGIEPATLAIVIGQLQQSISDDHKAARSGAEGRGAAASEDFERLAALLKDTLQRVVGLAQAGKQEQVAGLQHTLQSCAAASKLVQELLEARLPAETKVSRSGYLKALAEIIPRPEPEALNRWRDTWEPLVLEHLAIKNGRDQATEEDRREAEAVQALPLDTHLASNSGAMEATQQRGAEAEDAAALRMAWVGQRAMVRALRAGDARHAVATHRLADAVARLARRQRQRGEAPPTLYWHLRGPGSLISREPAFERLLQPDATGFRGVLSAAAITPGIEANYLSEGGFRVLLAGSGKTLVDSEVVAFEPQPQGGDEGQDLHNAAMVSGVEGVFPPNTLFKVKSVSEKEEFTTPGGLTVKQRLITVTATYRLPANTDAVTGDAKLCAPPTTLSYEGREAFVKGLDAVTAKPVLTMHQEFDRDFSWRDWKGAEYSLRDEMSYVRGKAVKKEHCTPGTRDAANGGMSLQDFVDKVNNFIRERRAAGHTGGLPDQYAYLNDDEVVGIRLYSGPAYQPINEFLRQLGKLTGDYRLHVAKSPSLTFAATVGHIMRAIRKLSAVVTADEAAKPLWRGVRGVLPESFWAKDSTGMVCATDLALMSTSRNQSTPVHYMGKGVNVLWQLQPSLQTDAGFHYGADISMLSQFAGEDEVLFPPYTMLRVQAAPVDKQTLRPGLMATAHEAENGTKTYTKICVVPQFA